MADISTEELERIEQQYHSDSGSIKPIKEFVQPEDLYKELIESIQKYHPSTDISLIEKAYRTAYEAHKGQVRKSGEAYIIHPLCVSIILAELELDKETIAAGLLHDVLEDTIMTEEEMQQEFGDEVLLGLAGIFKNYCGSKDFAARYGGEEFVLIVGGCHKKDALTRANTIRKRFAETVFSDASGEEHQFTVSLGVAEYDRPWNTASKFFDQSDQALYQAKNTGKNRVCSS